MQLTIQECLSNIAMIPILVATIKEVQNQLAAIQPRETQKPEGDEWLDAKGAARFLSMSENTFEKFCRDTNPRIKSYKVGGKNYFKKPELDLFMKTYAIKSRL